MTSSLDKKKKALARRRSKPTGSLPKPEMPPGEGKKGRWALAIAGVLLIALLAYLTGVRTGKTLTEIRRPEGTAAKEEGKEISQSPFRFLAPQDPAKRGQEGSSPKSRTQDPPSGKAGKEEVGRTEGKLEKEKVARSPEGGPLESSEGKEGSPSSAKYAVQVGAFNNSQDAQEMVKKLKSKGYAAYSVTGSAAAKGSWHRVRVGRFQSLQEARQFALAFEKKERIKTIITPISSP
jgi:cell division septation protein DedD